MQGGTERCVRISLDVRVRLTICFWVLVLVVLILKFRGDSVTLNYLEFYLGALGVCACRCLSFASTKVTCLIALVKG